MGLGSASRGTGLGGPAGAARPRRRRAAPCRGRLLPAWLRRACLRHAALLATRGTAARGPPRVTLAPASRGGGARARQRCALPRPTERSIGATSGEAARSADEPAPTPHRDDEARVIGCRGPGGGRPRALKQSLAAARAAPRELGAAAPPGRRALSARTPQPRSHRQPGATNAGPDLTPPTYTDRRGPRRVRARARARVAAAGAAGPPRAAPGRRERRAGRPLRAGRHSPVRGAHVGTGPVAGRAPVEPARQGPQQGGRHPGQLVARRSRRSSPSGSRPRSTGCAGGGSVAWPATSS